MMMWSGKSAAKTFFARFFEKKKKDPDPADVPSARKRSHSLFATNTLTLLSGDHVGGHQGDKGLLAGDSLSTALVDLNCSEARRRLLSLVPQPPSISRDDMSEPESDGSQTKLDDLEDSRDPEESMNPEGVSPNEFINPEVSSPDDSEEIDNLEEAKFMLSQHSQLSRLSSRRATDFSQADNDLRRFLASRKTKENSMGEQNSPPTNSTIDLRRQETNHSVIHRRIYGSVEALEGEERFQRNRRFRIETCNVSEEGPDIPPTPVLENPEQQTRWYYKYFLGKLHRNYVGQDSNKNIFILSVLEEKSFGKSQYRAVLWTSQGPKRIRFRGEEKVITLKQILCKLSSAQGKLERLPREVLSPNIQKDILWLEKQEGSISFKFGVIYAKPGQIMDDELLSNQAETPNFTNFLDLLGQRIRLKDWGGYKGGLDVRGDMTGKYSVYTQFEEHEIMYHVSTLLPFSPDDSQQVERKRHIGNDIVNIIFVDGTPQDLQRFNPLFIKSQFTHVYAAVCYDTSTMAYHLTVYAEKSVSLFGPSLPNLTGFLDPLEFRRFLLVKCINGEKATYNTEVFATKRERTYQLLLNDSMEQYGGEESRPAKDRMSLSEGVQDSNRIHWKKDNSRKDVFVKVGQSLKLENMVNGEMGPVPEGNMANKRDKLFIQAAQPWDPISVHSSLQIEVISGDSWVGVGLLVVAKEGGWILREDGPPEKVFSLAPILQVNIMESLGIMVFRTEKVGKDPSQVFVYRLSELETNNKILGREELREHGIEASKGCSVYSLSNREHSGLRMAVVVGKKVTVYSWIHAEEWITFTADTVQGFQPVQEISFLETPLVVTLVERRREAERRRSEAEGSRRAEGEINIVVGTRKGFEMIDVSTAARKEILSMDCEPSDIQEVIEDDQDELLLTHSCTSLLVRETETGAWQVTSEIQWNCQPNQVVSAFPYTLAFSLDTLEVRSTVNSSLLQTVQLNKLALISTKDDIFFATTKMINNHRKACDMEPMSKFCDPLYNIYKIPWALLMGSPHSKNFVSMDRGGSTESGTPNTPNPLVGGEVRIRWGSEVTTSPHTY